MSSSRPRRTRPLLIIGAVAALLVTAITPAAAAVPPERQKGQVGHYAILDGETSPLVNCRYAEQIPAKLDKFVAKPVLVWWPNSNTDNDTEHGRVGWQIRVQASPTPVDGPWATVYQSSIVKATAYEDKPGFDADDAAPFTTRGITWSKSGNKSYRLIYKLFWYNRNGTVKGTLSHWIAQYKFTGSLGGTSSDFCQNKVNLV